MSEIYDNWERLVRATLRREELKVSVYRTPSDRSLASSSSVSSFDFAGIGFGLKKAVFVFAMTPGHKSSPKAMRFLINVMKAMLPGELLLRTQRKSSGARIRLKAMKVTAGMPGVVSVAIDGQDKNQLVVLGDSVDFVELVKLLRTKVGFAEVVSVVDSANIQN